MQERLMNDLKEVIVEIAHEVARQVINEELPRILDTMSKPGNFLSDLIDYNKACELLHISKATLHSYINTGKLTKHFMVEGGKPFLSRKEIESLMKKAQKVGRNLTIGNYKDPSSKDKSKAA